MKNRRSGPLGDRWLVLIWSIRLRRIPVMMLWLGWMLMCGDLGAQGVPWSAAATPAGGGYLPCPDPTTEANFGASMDVSAQFLVVGAFPSSQIFLQERNPLTQMWQPAQIGDLATPTPGQIVGENWFGYSISVDGETLAVSAPLHGSPGNAIGIVYIFGKDPQTDSWQQQAVIDNPIPDPLDWFGMSISLQGNLLVVGSPGDRNAQGVDSGGVFIFVRDVTTDEWALEQVIWNPAASNPGADAFGEMVDLVGDRLVVGAPGTEGVGGEEAVGCGYIYQRSLVSFDLQQVIPNPDPAAGEAMGRSLALTDHHLAFGIPDDLPGGVANGGSVYLYRHDPISGQWLPAPTGAASATIPGQIPCPDPLDLDNFGIVVGLSGDVLAVGASGDEVNGFSSAGSCSIYERNATTGQWPLRQQLDNPQPAEGDQFGFALALDQNQLAVGVKLDPVNGIIGAGSAFLFERSGSFIRPDCNTDGAFNLADAIKILSILFTSGPGSDCQDACDANDDGSLNLSDAVMMLNDLYVPGSAPIPLPNPGCSIDPTDDTLDCIGYLCP